MSEPTWKHVQVESVLFGREDHGFITCILTLTWPGSGQGFGNKILGWQDASKYDNPEFDTDEADREMSRWVRGLLDVFGVDSITDIKGKRCWLLSSYGETFAIRKEFGKNTFWISDDAQDRVGHITKVEELV